MTVQCNFEFFLILRFCLVTKLIILKCSIFLCNFVVKFPKTTKQARTLSLLLTVDISTILTHHCITFFFDESMSRSMTITICAAHLLYYKCNVKSLFCFNIRACHIAHFTALHMKSVVALKCGVDCV